MECKTQIPMFYSLNRLSIEDEVCAVTAAGLKDYNLSLTEIDCELALSTEARESIRLSFTC